MDNMFNDINIHPKDPSMGDLTDKCVVFPEQCNDDEMINSAVDLVQRHGIDKEVMSPHSTDSVL